MNILVSACLIGCNCKYNGKNNKNDRLLEYLKDKNVISVCPEIKIGTPRMPVEIVNGRIKDKSGNDLDKRYKLGVESVINGIRHEEIDIAILQSRSPTCGVKQIYDGSFTKTLIYGQGIFARELIKRGYNVVDIEDFLYK